jgi:hypothetical protein
MVLPRASRYGSQIRLFKRSCLYLIVQCQQVAAFELPYDTWVITDANRNLHLPGFGTLC